MLRIALTALCIVAAMVAVKRERALERLGLLGYCDAVVVAGDTGEWRACRPGKLTGYPDLSLKDCKRRGDEGIVRYWYCPAPLGSGPAASL